MFTLYSMQRSGNSYKARLALAQLGIPYRLVEIDILKGESHTPEFLLKNPNGQVPLLEVAPGRYLAESNAILWYIAGGTPLAPEDRIDRAEALQWMFFEQHSLEPNLGAAYFWLTLDQGRPRSAKPRHRGLDGRRPPRARRDGQASCDCTTTSPPIATPSPTLRSTPTRTWRICAATISRRFPRCAPGSRASPPSLVT